MPSRGLRSILIRERILLHRSSHHAQVAFEAEGAVLQGKAILLHCRSGNLRIVAKQLRRLPQHVPVVRYGTHDYVPILCQRPLQQQSQHGLAGRQATVMDLQGFEDQVPIVAEPWRSKPEDVGVLGIENQGPHKGFVVLAVLSGDEERRRLVVNGYPHEVGGNGMELHRHGQGEAVGPDRLLDEVFVENDLRADLEEHLA
eukprot:scaffold3173_cov242-Pinguiococcus_pyrenoidosus.AAC.1